MNFKQFIKTHQQKIFYILSVLVIIGFTVPVVLNSLKTSRLEEGCVVKIERSCLTQKMIEQEIAKIMPKGINNEESYSFYYQNVINNFVVNKSLLSYIEGKLKIKISESDIIDQIKQDPMFMDEDSKFSIDIFNNFLKSNFIDEASYIESKKKNFGIHVVQNLINSMSLDDLYANIVASTKTMYKTTDLIRTNLSHFVEKVKKETLPMEEVLEYFNQHKENFKEKQSFEYEYITHKEIKNTYQLSPEDKELINIKLQTVIDDAVEKRAFLTIKSNNKKSLLSLHERFSNIYDEMEIQDLISDIKLNNKDIVISFQDYVSKEKAEHKDAFNVEYKQRSIVKIDKNKNHYFHFILDIKPQSKIDINKEKKQIEYDTLRSKSCMMLDNVISDITSNLDDKTISAISKFTNIKTQKGSMPKDDLTSLGVVFQGKIKTDIEKFIKYYTSNPIVKSKQKAVLFYDQSSCQVMFIDNIKLSNPMEASLEKSYSEIKNILIIKKAKELQKQFAISLKEELGKISYLKNKSKYEQIINEYIKIGAIKVTKDANLNQDSQLIDFNISNNILESILYETQQDTFGPFAEDDHFLLTHNKGIKVLEQKNNNNNDLQQIKQKYQNSLLNVIYRMLVS